MIDNIQKLYEIAGVYLCNMPDVDCSKECHKCEDYNPFTAEKQLELIKWLCINTYRNYIHFRFERDINNWKMECNMWGILECGSFEECLAKLVVQLWQELTDDQKQEIKRILE